MRFSVIQLPPLRQRVEDVQPLSAYFAEQICAEVPSIQLRPFSDGALEALETYEWPGNVRELKFAVERALCVARADQVEVGDLPPEVQGEAELSPEGGTFDEQIQVLESNLLKRALDRVDNSQKEAAGLLGLTYDRFRHLLRKHGLIGRLKDPT